MQNSSKWRENEVISLLQDPESALRLKGLDYDFKARLFRASIDMDVQSLRKTIDSFRGPIISRISQMQNTLDSQKWRDLLHDYERLLEQATQNSDEFEAYEARCMNRFGLTTSTRSVLQSESIGRISILAFIFIPLSFITSLFGMNVVEFGSGSIKLSVIIESAMALVFAVFMVWFLSSWIASLIGDLQENFYGLQLRFGILRKFAVPPTKAVPNLPLISRDLGSSGYGK
ncbi:hypothetical protein N7486_010518 [Penicillium sp. IBT 16267x]|nr:hypothetical protein N7486_010518 [Penicillium sp. IBT 16267x]